MAGWGVRRLVILSGHGGNADAIRLAVARLTDDLPRLDVVVLGAGATLSDAILAVAAADGISADAVGLHAGEGETSEMLALRPDLVRLERAVPGYRGGITDLMAQLRRSGLRSVTPTGTLGDAVGADGARGARYLAAQVECYRCALVDGPTMGKAPQS